MNVPISWSFTTDPAPPSDQRVAGRGPPASSPTPRATAIFNEAVQASHHQHHGLRPRSQRMAVR